MAEARESPTLQRLSADKQPPLFWAAIPFFCFCVTYCSAAGEVALTVKAKWSLINTGDSLKKCYNICLARKVSQYSIQAQRVSHLRDSLKICVSIWSIMGLNLFCLTFISSNVCLIYRHNRSLKVAVQGLDHYGPPLIHPYMSDIHDVSATIWNPIFRILFPQLNWSSNSLLFMFIGLYSKRHHLYFIMNEIRPTF
jgi:hypothetical protein